MENKCASRKQQSQLAIAIDLKSIDESKHSLLHEYIFHLFETVQRSMIAN